MEILWVQKHDNLVKENWAEGRPRKNSCSNTLVTECIINNEQTSAQWDTVLCWAGQSKKGVDIASDNRP